MMDYLMEAARNWAALLASDVSIMGETAPVWMLVGTVFLVHAAVTR